MLLISSLKDIHVTWHRVIKMPDLTSHMSGFKYSDIHKILFIQGDMKASIRIVVITHGFRLGLGRVLVGIPASG